MAVASRRPRPRRSAAQTSRRLLAAGPLALLAGRAWQSLPNRSAFVGPPAQARHAPAVEGSGRALKRPVKGVAGARSSPEVSLKAENREEGVSAGTVAAVAAAGAGLSAGAKSEQQTEAVKTLAFGVISALLFCAYVYASRGLVPATEWLSCYVIEYSLSIDNLFVFIVIFKYFKVPNEFQPKVLNLGILGAIIFRFIFVYLGAIVLQEFEFLILTFAVILIYASYQGFVKDDDDDDDDNLDDNFIVSNLRKVLDVSPKLDGENFFTQIDGKTFITPLLLCLLTIEFSDIVFATDSVPAVLGTTRDQFIAYSSNVFAVWGLRALFFLLQEAIVSFSYLESAVNFVLGFIGVKIILDFFEIVQIDVLVSLAIVLGTLLTGVVLSIKEMNEKGEEEEEGTAEST